MRILITGATGGVGRSLVEELVRAGQTVRALSRNPEPGRLPSGVEAVAGDLSEPRTIAPLLNGVDAVFLYANGNKHEELAMLMREAQVGKVVVLSTIDAGSDRPYAQYNRRRHLEVENAMAAAGLTHVCLRPGAFARNAIRFWAPAIATEARVRLPFPEAEQAPIDDRDLAAVAARALVSDALDGERIVLTGPESLSQRRQIALIGEAIARPIAVETVSEAEARGALGRQIPPAYVDLLMAQWRDEVGVPAVVTDAVERVCGRPPTDYATWARRNAERFRS